MGRRGVKVNNLDNIMLIVVLADNLEDNRIGKICKVLILSSEGVTTKEISEKLKISKTTVISYINKWNDFGINSIFETRGKNRKSTITYEIASDVTSTLRDKLPDQEGYSVNKWSCHLISDYIDKKYNIKYSKTSVHNLIKNLGFEVKWGNYHLEHKKKNKEYLAKLRKLEELS